MEDYFEHAKVFKALGDPKRAFILNMLSSGELCACVILEKFDMSQSTLSHHMKILCDCGLVNNRREGKWIYYSLNQEVISKTMGFFNAVTSGKESSISNEGSDCRRGCAEVG